MSHHWDDEPLDAAQMSSQTAKPSRHHQLLIRPPLTCEDRYLMRFSTPIRHFGGTQHVRSSLSRRRLERLCDVLHQVRAAVGTYGRSRILSLEERPDRIQHPLKISRTCASTGPRHATYQEASQFTVAECLGPNTLLSLACQWRCNVASENAVAGGDLLVLVVGER